MDPLDFLVTLFAVLAVLLVAGPVLVRFVLFVVADIKERFLEIEIRSAEVKEAHARANEATKNVDLVSALNGNLPVSRALLESGKIIDAQLTLMAEDINTRKPVNPVPHTMTYAPHFARTVNGNEALDKAESAANFTTPPTFTDLFKSGVINKNSFVLGFTQEGQPLQGDLGDVYSSLIIAKSGGGKTTLQRFLTAQAVMQGAKLWVADPHGMTKEGMVNALKPLTPYFASKPAVEDEDIRDMVNHFVAMGEMRIKATNPDTTVQILAVDELNDIAMFNEYGEEIIPKLVRAARAYRKVNMYVFASAQSANAEDLGGTTGIRKSFVGRYVLKSDKDAATKLVPDKKLLEMVPFLEPGRSIFVPTKKAPVALAIPNTTVQDLENCFGTVQVKALQEPSYFMASEVDNDNEESTKNAHFSNVQVVEPLRSPLRSPLQNEENATSDAPKVNLLDSRCVAAIERFKNGESKRTIIADLWETKGGDSFTKASAEFDNALRSIL